MEYTRFYSPPSDDIRCQSKEGKTINVILSKWEADNDDLGANVAEEVRTKSQRKNREKRAQENAQKRDAAETHESKVIEVRETKLSAQGGKSVKTDSALQLSTVSNSKSSTAVSGCRYKKSVKTPKAGVTIRKRPFQRPISIAASSPAKAALLLTNH